jgi:hypothetical protein
MRHTPRAHGQPNALRANYHVRSPKALPVAYLTQAQHIAAALYTPRPRTPRPKPTLRKFTWETLPH